MKSQERNEFKTKTLYNSLGIEKPWNISYSFLLKLHEKSRKKIFQVENGVSQPGHWKAMKYFLQVLLKLHEKSRKKIDSIRKCCITYIFIHFFTEASWKVGKKLIQEENVVSQPGYWKAMKDFLQVLLKLHEKSRKKLTQEENVVSQSEHWKATKEFLQFILKLHEESRQ